MAEVYKWFPTNHVNYVKKKTRRFLSDSIVPKYNRNEGIISMTCFGKKCLESGGQNSPRTWHLPARLPILKRCLP